MSRLGCGIGLFALMMGCAWADAQSLTNMAALKGLAPVSALSNSTDGKAALASNFTVTGGIQTGVIRQPTLLPFSEQQQQALRDAFITDGNLAQLTDGFGTTLGAAYQARAHYLDRKHFTSISKAVADLIAYANSTSGSDSNAGKYFFANGTTNGKKPVSDEAMAIFKDVDGAPDPFGLAYGRPGGTPGADAYGDSRPFQTEPTILPIVGPDYFNVPAGNDVYNRGPIMNLIDSPSFPSGHTTYGYMGSLAARRARARSLSGDGRPRRGIRQRPHHHGGALRHGRAGRANGRDLRSCPSARQRSGLHEPAAEERRDDNRDVRASGPGDHRRLPGGGRERAGRPDQGARGGLRRYGCGLRASGHRPLQRAGDERGLLRHDADLRAGGRASGDRGQGGGCRRRSRQRPDIC